MSEGDNRKISGGVIHRGMKNHQIFPPCNSLSDNVLEGMNLAL